MTPAIGSRGLYHRSGDRPDLPCVVTTLYGTETITLGIKVLDAVDGDFARGEDEEHAVSVGTDPGQVTITSDP